MLRKDFAVRLLKGVNLAKSIGLALFNNSLITARYRSGQPEDVMFSLFFGSKSTFILAESTGVV